MKIYLSGAMAFSCVIAGTAWSDEIRVILPEEFASAEAPGTANPPANYRLQQVYLAGPFSAILPGNNLLTRLAWRTDGNLRVPFTSSGDRMTINLSTTQKGLDDLENEFAKNIGMDQTTVFDGPITWQITDADPVGGPRDFEYEVSLDPPFRYDPTQGNLLMDLTMVGGSNSLGLDFADNVSLSETTRLIFVSGSQLDVANQQFAGHVIEFVFVPEPVSSALLLFGLGYLVLPGRNWRLSRP